MKKSACLFAILVIFASFNSGNKKSQNRQHQLANLSIVEDIEKKDVAIAYTQCSLAYLIEGVLYFHNFKNNGKVKFIEESEPIFNFVFDAEGKTLYYSVERDNTLWLKSAEISISEIIPQWLISWNLNKENDFMSLGMSPLFYHEGKVVIMHGYHDDSQSYGRMTYYYINNGKIAQLDRDIEFIRSTYGMLSWEVSNQYFKVKDEQLYYIHNSASVCLTDKIDFKAIEEKNKDDFEISDTRYYSDYIFSPDMTKVAFGAVMLEGAEWVEGPFCLANIDGSKQMVLEESNFIVDSHPKWLNNNEFAFKTFTGDLYIANNNKNSTQKIAEGVWDFKTKIIEKEQEQEIKNLNPSYVHVLDFSHSAKAEWTLRDTLLSQLSSGKRDWDKMTREEKALLEKYDEVYNDIWDIIGGGDTWYNAGGPYKVTASSYLKSESSNNYEPKNANDLNYKSAWVEGVSGYGIGEFLIYTFKAQSALLTEIIVVNGYVKSEAAYRDNSRVKKLKVYLNDKPYAILNIEDKIANQGFKVEPIGYSDRENWDALKNKPDWTLKFEILDVYKGLKYDDTAISEIYFDGIGVLCFAKGTKVQLADNSSKNIENLNIGDLVAYIDLETNQIKSAKIEKLEKVIHHGLVKYKFESGLEITATQDHPFRIEKQSWASLKPDKSKQYKGFENIEKVELGDFFLTAEGSDKLISIDFLEGEQETYTISRLSSGDNFIANGLIVGIEELKNEQ